jgi:hypothetical protein
VIFIPILMIATAVAVVWTIVKYQTAYAALIESLPPQFQDGLSSKFAFPEYVLRPSTPLPLQAEYVKSQIGSCFAALGISLLCLLYEKLLVGSIALVVFFSFTVLTIKSWKTHQSNSKRQMFHDNGEQP